MSLLRRSFSVIVSSRSSSGHLLSLNRRFCKKPSNNVDGSKYPLATHQQKSVDKIEESKREKNGVEKKDEEEYEWIDPNKELFKPPPTDNERLDAYRIAVDMAEENNFNSGVKVSSFTEVMSYSIHMRIN